ncbi:archaetidylserine decarboxylase [Sphingomonas montanisoli]|uniref:phosphatidylserine decarboxylase n=1 Tax=Sphingomonas montanisoli TaxID=2606412 RepID=A0A5D9C772_9SPHN|nr:archaetidylserine decarboxylase [Sphingomonas montanisoli]TZG27529.1 phosphatidylserine decarboxylase [Sphingomonas montanisoli]
MTIRDSLMKFLLQEDVNFLLTNRLPRRALTTAMGRLAKVETPIVAQPMMRAWRFFSGADLSEAAEPSYKSLRDAFVRALKPGARTYDPDPNVLASPCDANVGAGGTIDGDKLYQIKGAPYALSDLIPDPAVAARVRDGRYITLRLTAGMYHRFHAPSALRVRRVTYLSGDCWNVNPIALKRVEKLFCKNERAVIEADLPDGVPILLVPVAAILVAGIRLNFLDTEKLLREQGSTPVACDVSVARGEEMGWFEHGSTIIVFTPPGFELADGVGEGSAIRAGQALMRRSV